MNHSGCYVPSRPIQRCERVTLGASHLRLDAPCVAAVHSKLKYNLLTVPDRAPTLRAFHKAEDARVLAGAAQSGQPTRVNIAHMGSISRITRKSERLVPIHWTHAELRLAPGSFHEFLSIPLRVAALPAREGPLGGTSALPLSGTVKHVPLPCSLHSSRQRCSTPVYR